MNKSIESLKLLYKNKDYGGSIDMLIENKNIFNKDIFHYNMGTLYAQKGELGIARYHLEKAKSLEPHDYIITNLNYVKQKLGYGLEQVGMDKVDQISFSIKELKEEDYAIGGLTALMIFFICLLILSKYKKIICSISLILSLSFFLFGQFVEKKMVNGILLKDSYLRTGPSEIFPAKTLLNNGQRIILGKKMDGWQEVVVPRALEGWISQIDVGLY